MYMLGCKAALEQDLSIGAIFRRKTYWDVPLILSTRLNGMYLSLLVLLVMAVVVSSNSVLPEVTVGLQTCIYMSVLFSERGAYIDSYLQNGQIEKQM